MAKKKIVILGMGFGGAHAAIQLSERLKNRAEIKAVDINNYHLFKPMLHEFAAGSVGAGHIMQPIRHVLRGRPVSFNTGMVQTIDMSRKVVCLCKDCVVCHRQDVCPIKDFGLMIEDIQRHGESVLPYDYLILALGGIPNFYDIEGAGEHSFPINTLEDADRIRKHILHAFAIAEMVRDPEKRKQILTGVIGGLPDGAVQVSGAGFSHFGRAIQRRCQLARSFSAPGIYRLDGLEIYLPEASHQHAAVLPLSIGMAVRPYL